MKLYYWSSLLLCDYTLGKIVVLAEDVNDARNKARSHFNALGYIGEPETFECDIAKEPNEVETGVMFINGSA